MADPVVNDGDRSGGPLTDAVNLPYALRVTTG
jgi:hypothetical protein